MPPSSPGSPEMDAEARIQVKVVNLENAGYNDWEEKTVKGRGPNSTDKASRF